MAIAFDAASGGFENPNTSLTFSHTCTGSDLVLFVGVTCSLNDNVVTGVTYNGDAMTLVRKNTPNGTTRWLYLWKLISPDTGTHDVVVSSSENTFIGATSASYTGCDQTTNPEASADDSTTGTGDTSTITTLTDNAWAGMVASAESGTIAAGASTTKRDDDTIAITGIFDSNGAVTPAGNRSLAYTCGSSFDIHSIIYSIKPAGTSDTVSPAAGTLTLGGNAPGLRSLLTAGVVALTLSGLAPTVTVSAQTISAVTPAPWKVFQRSGSTGPIAITGTYTGTPTQIEASFNGGSFATIDAAPAGGVFSGTLSSQAQGRGTLTIRFTNNTAISTTVANVGVGDVFLIGGDSIAEGRGTNPQVYSGASKLSAFRQDDAWIEGNDPIDTGTSSGSHWPLLATLLIADQSVPIAFITTATGSTDVAGSANEWADGNSAYLAALQQVTDSGVNAVKGVLMHLGPNAIVNASTLSQATYNAAIDAMASGFNDDLAGTPKVAVVVCGEVSTGSPPDRRAAEDNIRAAVIQAWGDNADVAIGPVLIDQDYSDGVHPTTDAQLLVVARRWWPALKESFYGAAAGFGRGPRISTAALSSARDTITVTVDRDLASGTTYGGFRVEDGGTPATIVSSTRTGTRTIDVVVSAPTSGVTTISFASNDDAVGQTVPTSTAITLPDANTITLPLEPFIDVVASLTVQPSAGTLTLSGTTSSLLHQLNMTAGTLALSGQAPTVVIQAAGEVPAGTLTLSGAAPSLQSTMPVAAVALVLTGQAPSVTVVAAGDVLVYNVRLRVTQLINIDLRV